jgi:hypothetical protein
MTEKYNYKGGQKKPSIGSSKKSTKGAHGGGVEYRQHTPKYPQFGLGTGFKQKPKPGKSQKGNQIPK